MSPPLAVSMMMRMSRQSGLARHAHHHAHRQGRRHSTREGALARGGRVRDKTVLDTRTRRAHPPHTRPSGLNVAGGRAGTLTGIIRSLLIAFAGLLAAGFAALALALGEPAVFPIAIAGGALLAIFIALAWLLLYRLTRPLDRLALDVRIIARENPGHRLGLVAHYWVGRLAESIEAMRGRPMSAEAHGAQALADAQNQGAEQKRWLEAILLDLTDGIVVCNLQHQVLLYNEAAADLFGGT